VTVFFAEIDQSVRILFRNKRSDLAIKYFPYLDLQIRTLFSKKQLKVNDFEQLYCLYANDPDFLYQFTLVDGLSSEKKLVLQQSLAIIDPLFFVQNIDFKNLDFRTAWPLANNFIEAIQKYGFSNQPEAIDYWNQRDIAAQFFNFADEAYRQHEVKLAADYYQKAFLVNEFVMGDMQAVFLTEKNLERVITFLQAFKDFQPKNMKSRFDQYIDIYKNVLIYLFQHDRLDEFFVLADAILAQEENFSWFLFRDLVKISQTAEDKVKLIKVHEHYNELSTWKDFWPLKN
jgi:hypothetical protein